MSKGQTPSKDTVEVEQAKLRHNALPHAIDRIVSLIDSENERLAFKAAVWVAERFVPKQADAGGGGSTELAKVLAETLREIFRKVEPIPIIDVSHREIGEPVVLGPG